MVSTKKGLGDDSSYSDSSSNEASDVDSDFDSDDTSSDDEDIDSQNLTAASANESDHKSDDEAVVDEEEDEVIKAIRRENTRERDHPPAIKCEDHVVDISFHPFENLLGVASITGDVLLYKYTNEENLLAQTLELHTKACRDIEFSGDGKVLFSTSKDKSIMLSDVDSGKLMRFYEKAHDDPVYCLSVLDEHLIATGDDNGTVKVWDTRESTDTPILRFKKNEDYISDITTEEQKQYLLCASGDGILTTYDLPQRKFLMQSEEYDDEFTCLGLFRSDTKLLAGSTKGKLYLFNQNEFGLHSDIFPGPKTGINSLIPITEKIVVTACEDGILRATHLFPHRHLGVVGQHDLSVERVDICNNGQFIASCGDDADIKFWNIQYFEDFEKVAAKHSKSGKKREMDFNLPSSKRQNVADFFSDM